MSAGLSLSDAQIDTADWELTLILTDPTTDQPFDLTNSHLRVDFRSLIDGSLVATCASDASDGSLSILTPSTAGKVTILSRAASRTWRVPLSTVGRIDLPQTVEGDVLRRPSSDPDAAIEFLARIKMLVRSGTTAWPSNSP